MHLGTLIFLAVKCSVALHKFTTKKFKFHSIMFFELLRKWMETIVLFVLLTTTLSGIYMPMYILWCILIFMLHCMIAKTRIPFFVLLQLP